MALQADRHSPAEVSEPSGIAEAWARELPGLDLMPFLVSGGILRLAQQVERAFTAVARSSGIGPGDLRVLLALRRSAPDYAMSPTALFKRLMITSGAVSKQVDRLAELGLVERVSDPDVLRGVLIGLKPAGSTIAEDAMRRISTSFCGLENLSAAEAGRALDLLGLLQRTMDTAETAERA
ncbi:MarR family winged helix-turn-helix transcriptional regulator [Streptomyces sp. NPDC048448]|uniref:MarR family winged helix-turn-helix transcriptional regulator n=1 Tax=Streptomyces kaempferi TaxID=333725 RepID=A0ABW3X9G6_9ACTN|nr:MULTISPECIES: MarR family transcriptional regulator [unclassified Streptomyces]QIY61393.1 MarR family transcriptional regulator [Streptomyces sp. RPA4-2]